MVDDLVKKNHFEQIYSRVCEVERKSLPFKCRGISINRELIKATLEALNEHPQKTLPQNCRNDIRDRTPDGLDRRIKEKLNTDLRTANIISDILSRAGIVEVVQVTNPLSGRLVKGTKLIEDWSLYAEKTKETVVKLKQQNESNAFNRKKQGLERQEYVTDTNVVEFIEWMAGKLDKPNSFVHKYYHVKTRKQWQCDSLYNAYETYHWPFSGVHPSTGKYYSGNTFDLTFNFLSKVSETLSLSIENNEVELCKECSLKVLEWGGVAAKNREKLSSLGDGICSYYKSVKDKINPSIAELSNLNGIIMNSGFTKIYSLFVPELIMYDGRVGSALGLLVRKFSEENKLTNIPSLLKFGYKMGRESNPSYKQNRRNPSTATHRFPEISYNPKKHILDNLRASWLLQEILKKNRSKFDTISSSGTLDMRLTALQSSLFMIGYDVRDYSRR